MYTCYIYKYKYYKSETVLNTDDLSNIHLHTG